MTPKETSNSIVRRDALLPTRLSTDEHLRPLLFPWGGYILLRVILFYPVDCYTLAKDIPNPIWELLRQKPRQANIILFSAPRLREAEQREHQSDRFWLVSRSSQGIGPIGVDFVLSCIDGPIGAYPICIFSPHPYKVVANEAFSRPRLRELAEKLYHKVNVKRVFSVFAFAPVSQVFADEWQRLTGIAQREVYYAAKQSYCTKASLRYRPLPQELKHSMRLAMESDIPGVANLCYQFAQDSEPFVLTPERALDEAKYLVSNKKVWVHLGPGTSDTIASIVAVTREGGDVSSITKVFTNADWRRMGCAKRLTAFVCEELLRERSAVVLYVGHDNPAKSVYSSIGFVGLGEDEPSIDGVDDWLELGFDRERVELGHW